MVKITIDRIDNKILSCLQQNADISINELSEKVGITKNPCWRRLQKLKEAGVVQKTVALLDAKKVNVGTTVFMNIRTSNHSAEWLAKFATAVDKIPEVVEFHRMSGDVDYMLKVVVPDIEAFDNVYKALIKDVELSDVSSYFAMEEIKSTTALPLHYLSSKK